MRKRWWARRHPATCSTARREVSPASRRLPCLRREKPEGLRRQRTARSRGRTHLVRPSQLRRSPVRRPSVHQAHTIRSGPDASSQSCSEPCPNENDIILTSVAHSVIGSRIDRYPEFRLSLRYADRSLQEISSSASTKKHPTQSFAELPNLFRIGRHPEPLCQFEESFLLLPLNRTHGISMHRMEP